MASAGRRDQRHGTESIKMSTDDFEKELSREKFIVEVTESIWLQLNERGLSGVDLAKKLGVSRSRVSKMLSGHENLTLRSLADIAQALEMVPTFSLERPIEAQARQDVIRLTGWFRSGKYAQEECT